ncbi:hypothetical protein ACDN41_12105 [Priestia aryabhattai]|uniref:hypothetical protein n=1 Tax=Priestia aryabhattai TaxID=412384 RepID=UPI0035324A5D
MGMLDAAIEDLKKDGYTEEQITNAFKHFVKVACDDSITVKNIDELFEEEEAYDF